MMLLLFIFSCFAVWNVMVKGLQNAIFNKLETVPCVVDFFICIFNETVIVHL